MNKYYNLKYRQAWGKTGIKDFTGREYVLTRFERVQIVRVKMNRMYIFIFENLKKQLLSEEVVVIC